MRICACGGCIAWRNRKAVNLTLDLTHLQLSINFIHRDPCRAITPDLDGIENSSAGGRHPLVIRSDVVYDLV